MSDNDSRPSSLHTITGPEVRMVMVATTFVSEQEFRLADYHDGDEAAPDAATTALS